MKKWIIIAIVNIFLLSISLVGSGKHQAELDATVSTGNREIAGKEIINAYDVIQTFKMEGINFKPEMLLFPKEYKVEDTEPMIYKDSQGNLLFIYTFDSFVERRESFREYEHINRFAFTLEDSTYLPRFYSVKNLQLVYLMAYPDKEKAQAAIDYRRKVDQVIFSNLNNGKEIVFTGESPSWKAKVSVRYYEHWWTDGENKLQYESYHIEAPTISYKGKIPKQPVSMEYSLNTRTGKMSGTREVTPEELTRVISLGYGGGNGVMPRDDDSYEVKITLDGKTEEFELKVK